MALAGLEGMAWFYNCQQYYTFYCQIARWRLTHFRVTPVNLRSATCHLKGHGFLVPPPPSSSFPKVTSVSFAQTLEDVFGKITGTNICDLVMSIVIMAVVFVVKELNDKYKAKLPVPIPIEVIMVRRGVPSKGGLASCSIQ